MKREKGFTGVDLTIAIAVIIMFTTLISIIFVNIYMNSTSTSRGAMATTYATQIIENIEKLYYNEVTDEQINDIINNMNIPSGYDVTFNLENYKETNYKEEDLIKIVTVNIKYMVGKKEEQVEFQKIKAKEVLIIPNKPELNEQYVPVKYIKQSGDETGYFKITNENDPEWYNYSNKEWAYVMLRNGLGYNSDDIVTTPTAIYVSIPRYGTDTNGNIVFLYETTNQTVNDDGNLSDETYTTTFADDETGIFLPEGSADAKYTTLNNSKYGPKNEHP